MGTPSSSIFKKMMMLMSLNSEEGIVGHENEVGVDDEVGGRVAAVSGREVGVVSVGGRRGLVLGGPVIGKQWLMNGKP